MAQYTRTLSTTTFLWWLNRIGELHDLFAGDLQFSDPCVRKDQISDRLYCISLDDRLTAIFFFLNIVQSTHITDAITWSLRNTQITYINIQRSLGYSHHFLMSVTFAKSQPHERIDHTVRDYIPHPPHYNFSVVSSRVNVARYTVWVQSGAIIAHSAWTGSGRATTYSRS